MKRTALELLQSAPGPYRFEERPHEDGAVTFVAEFHLFGMSLRDLHQESAWSLKCTEDRAELVATVERDLAKRLIRRLHRESLKLRKWSSAAMFAMGQHRSEHPNQ